mmetsp:Transcript_16231/g.13814  ORF Transcript_16231/g.13814 Transcript_16231/m.13814 type:complete len:413 (-) Transcript_16231:210-1448(-)
MEEHNSNEDDYQAKKRKKSMSLRPQRALSMDGASPIDNDPNAPQLPGLGGASPSHNMKEPQSPEHVNINVLERTGTQEVPENNGDSSAVREAEKGYISKMLQNMVDDVCLFHAKNDAVNHKYADKLEDEGERENLKQELENIPLRTVPLVMNPDDPKYRSLMKVPIHNEIESPAGYLGWCFVCRGPADLYCKDTRVPICSVDCKLRHFDEIDGLKSGSVQNNAIKLIYLHDAAQVFAYLCKLSGKDPANKTTPDIVKNKMLTLELIMEIMEKNIGPTFLARKEFREIIKENLCDSILKNSISLEKAIFSYSLGIFVALVNNFREHLKTEIAIFVDSVFMKMLESTNSSYIHRHLALQVFYKIVSRARNVLEFYVNYDCDLQSTNTTEKIIEMICKVAQGKYGKPEYGTVIQP